MKHQLLFLFVLLFTFAISQNPCYVQPITGFSVTSNGITSADFNGDGIMDIATAGSSLSINAGTGTGTFVPAINYPHGLLTTNPSDIVTADFNNDGKPDVAISSYTNQVSVMMKTLGGFAAPQIFSTVGGGVSLVSEDFNNDGKLDIAIANNVIFGLSILFNNGSGSFNSAVNYTIPVDPIKITSADFNNDGKKDIALAHVSGNSILIYLNNGIGQFTTSISVATPTICNVLKAADLNNDGNNDLALGLYNGNMLLLNGNGSASFTSSATYSVGFSTREIGIADMNGDNVKDIIAVDAFDVVNSYINTGSGSFTRTTWLSPIFMSEITLNDFTGDGRPDLAGVAGGGTWPVSILVNNGVGGFFTTRAFKVLDINVNTGNYHVTTGDMNNDGKLDIISANNNFGSFSILQGNGAGVFSISNYSTSILPLATNVGDFNGDGKLDVAVVGHTNNLSVYINASANVYTLSGSYGVGANPARVLSSDMNNDGKLDLVVANYGSNNISVLFGTGIGTFTGQTAYAVGSNANDITIADFNNDGYKDVAVAVWNNTVKVFNGSSTGSLTSSTNYIVSSVPGGITSGDFNNDGSIDLAISCAFSNNFAVKLNNGTGSFGTSSFYNIGWDNRTIITGDYNGDGNLDIATGCDQSSGGMQIFNGNGLGGFTAASHYIMGENARVISSGDFNGDSKPDFASASSHYVAVLLTSSFPTITVSGATLTCSSAPLTLTASGAAGYYWSGNPNGSGSNVVYYPTSNSIYTITGINSPACPVVSIKSVSVIPSPTVLISSSSNSLCNGSSITLIATGALSYTWNNGTQASSVIVTPSASSAFTVIGTAANACTNTTVKFLTVSPQPTLSITAPSSVCANDSATLTASGASTFIWSTSSTSSIIVVNPSSSSCYSLIGTSNLGCTNIAIACITVVALPNLIISPASPSICFGSSQTFTASGAGSYTWLPNINSPTYNVLPQSNTTYTLFGSLNGCTSSTIVNLSVNPLCTDVWPGDANSDGVVDATDVLEIGLSFSNTGTARPLQGNTYSPHFASNWTGTVSTGKNKCNADCNGDGVINFADTVAVSSNFLLTHAFKQSQTSTLPDIKLVSLNANLISPTQLNKLDIYLSDTTAPLNVYGTAFAIDFDQSLIETNVATIYYTPSFINTNNTNVEFKKLNFAGGKIYGATVRTNALNANGGGKIGEFYFKLKSGVADGTILNVSIGNSKKVLANGNTSQLIGNSLQLIVSSTLGLNEGSLNRFNFYPNPAMNNITFIAPSEANVAYEIRDISGRSILQGKFSERKTIDISTIAAGSYLLVFNCGETFTYNKLIIRH